MFGVLDFQSAVFRMLQWQITPHITHGTPPVSLARHAAVSNSPQGRNRCPLPLLLCLSGALPLPRSPAPLHVPFLELASLPPTRHSSPQSGLSSLPNKAFGASATLPFWSNPYQVWPHGHNQSILWLSDKAENGLGSNRSQRFGFCIGSVWIGLKWVEAFNCFI
jgi:hypothetical protein